MSMPNARPVRPAFVLFFMAFCLLTQLAWAQIHVDAGVTGGDHSADRWATATSDRQAVHKALMTDSAGSNAAA